MASLSRTVHLRSADQVLTAYENWKVPHFAIINNKQLMFAYDSDTGDLDEGLQLLQEWLHIINNSGSAGIYTLCIYKGLKGKEITNTTPYNGSVNFQFHEYKYPPVPGTGNTSIDPGIKLLSDQMAAMQLQIQKLQDGDNDEEGEEDSTDRIIGKISTLLSNPVIAGLISHFIPKPDPGPRQITGQPGQPLQPVQEPGKVTRIAGVKEVDQEHVLTEALNKLKATVPNLPDVMCQLCKLSEKNPVQFKLYLAALMAMKL